MKYTMSQKMPTIISESISRNSIDFNNFSVKNTHTHTHTHLTAFILGLPR